MKPTFTTYRHSLTTAICVATLLVASSPTATPFGDNDGGLDLPGLQDPGTPGSGGSGGSSNQQSDPGNAFGVVSLAGADTVVVETSDPARGRVTISTDQPVPLSIATSADSGSGSAAAQSAGQGVSAAVEQGQVSLQGSAVLPGTSPYLRQLLSPADAQTSLSLILVDSDPGASLAALLNGNVLLDQWRLVDDPVALDLDGFAQLIQNQAGSLAASGEDVRVTWLIATIDSSGQLHFTATRVSTLGGSIEVSTN